MSIEILEPRIAPAAVVHLTDRDGDLITVQVSSGDVEATQFDDPIFNSGIDFLNTDHVTPGADLTISVIKAGGGDGRVVVDFLSGDFSLGHIKIDGVVEFMHLGGPAISLEMKSLTNQFVTLSPVGTVIVHGDVTKSYLSGDAIQTLLIEGNIFDSAISAFDQTIPELRVAGSVADSTLNGVNVAISGNLVHSFVDINPYQFNQRTAGGTLKVGGSMVKSYADPKDLYVGGDLVGGTIGEIFRLEPYFGTPGAADDFTNVVIGGSVRDGAYIAGANLKSIKIGRDLSNSTILGTVSIDQVTIGGSMKAGDIRAGQVGYPGYFETRSGHIGTVKIKGNITGLASAPDRSSAISTSGPLGSIDEVVVGGSIIGGGDFVGYIHASASIGKVIVKGDVRGGPGYSSGAIISDGKLGSVDIGGDLRAGTRFGNSGVIVADRISSVHIHDDLLGNSRFSAQIIATGGPGTAASIGSVTVDGDVSRARINAGVGLYGQFLTGNATIGTVTVHGDWANSHVNAGVTFLNGDFKQPGGVSKIGKIQIDGRISDYNRAKGASSFLAHEIGSFTFANYRPALHWGADNDFTIGFGNGLETVVIGEV